MKKAFLGCRRSAVDNQEIRVNVRAAMLILIFVLGLTRRFSFRKRFPRIALHDRSLDSGSALVPTGATDGAQALAQLPQLVDITVRLASSRTPLTVRTEIHCGSMSGGVL